MKIGQAIAMKRASLSFEFFPPKTLKDEESLFKTIDLLGSFHPTFVSVTYGAGGSTRDRTAHTVERIRWETALEPMPHLTCIGTPRAEVQAILEGYHAKGIENVLALRGDPPMGVTEFAPEADEFESAMELVRFISQLGGFSIGVAVYPEGHVQAKSMEEDLDYAKSKIEAGADFAITQMFFDNNFFYRFRERAEGKGVRVPIIPGIMPITDFKKISGFAKMCGASIPTAIAARFEKATSPEAARNMGIELACEMIDDLLRNGTSYFHIYTLNRAEAVREVCQRTDLLHRLGMG